MAMRMKTKGRVAAPAAALGCLAVCASILEGGGHGSAQSIWHIHDTSQIVAV